ncbi:MAG: hypothetical protein EPO07_03305 [Verrucomicrobia bacterium]|nr:MAG: hypothetical protein EPO07_03305 [Verrucomicrobiota bacterium]
MLPNLAVNAESIFFYSLVAFALSWSVIAALYFFKVIPIVRRLHGERILLEATFQLNLTRHIKEYGLVARQEQNKAMLRTFHLLNSLIVLSVLFFLTGVLATLF